MPLTHYDPTKSAPITSIVRAAIVVSTLALFVGSLVNAVLGFRDIAVLLALAAPLGISAWGFVHAGHNEAAMGLVCCVLITVITLILALNPLGVHDMAVMAYGGIVLFGALLFSRKSFILITGLTLFAATTAFVYDLNGFSRSVIEQHSGWPQYLDFLLLIAVFAILGRAVAEKLFGSLGEAHIASSADKLTGLRNRSGFVMEASMRLRAAGAEGKSAVLVIADLDHFRRTNSIIGHQAADNILREGARRLAAEYATDVVARIGDDEFAILRVGEHESHAQQFARTVHEALHFDYMGVSVRNAAGYARFPRDASGIESLMMTAESGVAAAKDQEGIRYAGPADRI
jgi:diguanylate cyclase (GGDEF)-like protein